MTQDDPTRVVGIDLGTTNTVAAVNSWNGETHTATIVPLLQYTDVDELERLPQLPSVLYHALPEERFGEHTPTKPWVVGKHAKRRGSETPERVITSAKSWLCHPAVDRTAAILPWVSRNDERDETDLTRLSPVDASAAILRHVVMALSHAGHAPTDAEVVVTVPASFDQVAKQLTLDAARRAGLTVRLLEEPQAAFYDWLHRASRSDVDVLRNCPDGFLVLVVDVGGGTTDLTLLRVEPNGPDDNPSASCNPSERVKVERVAVGRHLLLGGDNVDLALAHLVERKLDAHQRLAPSDFSQLVAACQVAKERLLGDNPPAKVPIRLAQRGSSLFGNVRSSELLREEVERVMFDGFLPDADQDTPLKRSKSGLLAFGLPFESDAAVTHHLGQFLTQQGISGSGRRIDGVLFNGGLFKSGAIVERVTHILERWMGHPVWILPNAAPDEAVARGAVHYGLALQGKGLRFAGGSAHGYYVGVDSKHAKPSAVCVLPKGTPEDLVQHVDALPLRLTVGKAVRFDLHANSVSHHTPGQLVELDDLFERVTTVGTRLAASSDDSRPTSEIPVVLKACLTAVGTLELACEERDAPRRRYGLTFEVRTAKPEALAESTASSSANVPSNKPSTAPKANPSAGQYQARDEAVEMLHRVFGKGRKDVSAREVKDLWRELEHKLGPRQTWDAALTRSLADVLLPMSAGRRRTVDHERLYFALTGFLLRPGFGYLGDTERVALFAPLFEPGLTFSTERPNWDQFYIAWRRVAAGLPELAQVTIRDVCDPFVAPTELKLKKSKAFKTPEVPALWELISWLERVPSERRAALGQWLLDRTWTSRDPKWWEWLGRVGSREPLYASAHHVVRPRHAEAWLEHLLSEPWDVMPTAAFAAVQLARCTNDRARDVNGTLREKVAAKLQARNAPEAWVESVLRHVPPTRSNAREEYGDELPPGLQLV